MLFIFCSMGCYSNHDTSLKTEIGIDNKDTDLEKYKLEPFSTDESGRLLKKLSLLN